MGRLWYVTFSKIYVWTKTHLNFIIKKNKYIYFIIYFFITNKYLFLQRYKKLKFLFLGNYILKGFPPKLFFLIVDSRPTATLKTRSNK